MSLIEILQLVVVVAVGVHCYFVGRIHGMRQMMRLCDCRSCQKDLATILSDPEHKLPFPWKQEADR